MSGPAEPLPAGWCGEELTILSDPETGIRAVVALHDTRLGPAFGGIRRTRYGSLVDAIADACRLAEAMTYKCAISGVRGGGGKVVIPWPEDLDLAEADVRERAYRLVAAHVAALAGRYYTGPDVGTTSRDLTVIAEHTDYVAVPERTGDLADPTARGVFAGIRAVARRLGVPLRGLRVGVQGVGAVGRRLVDLMGPHGVELWVGDLDRAAVERCAARHACHVVDPNELPTMDLDVFAPCALGGVIDARVANRTRARSVAGSANNVLGGASAGATLHRRGVLYAPDFVINSGALIHGATTHLTGKAPSGAMIDGLEVVLDDIFERSARRGDPPEDVAMERARAVLAATPHRRFSRAEEQGNG